MFSKLAQMARDIYAVSATDSDVKREFSISGNIVNNCRNRLNSTTISNIMQLKRWLARNGTLTKYLKNNQIAQASWADIDSKTENEDDEKELNQKLIDWLKH
jgi:hAT family C-terminal dimerisation region